MNLIRPVHSFLLLFLFVSTAFADANSIQKKNSKDKFQKIIVKKLNRLRAKTKVIGNKLIDTMDVNRDGKIDSRMVYLNGTLFKEEADYNFDGKFDKTDWYYKTGDIIQTTTIDRNYDGKVDWKIIKTLKGAKQGHYLTVQYYDNNFDGTFDTKRSKNISELQATTKASNDQGQSVNCAVDQYTDVHLPAILNDDDYQLVDELIHVFQNSDSYREYFDNDSNTYGFNIKVQSACKQEGSKADQELFKDENIQESIKKGVVCMAELDTNPGTKLQSSINFRKILAGLTGHDLDDNGDKARRHGSPLKLVCKLPSTNQFNWSTGITGLQNLQLLAVATTTNNDQTSAANLGITKIAKPPVIVFRPGIAAALGASMKYYPNQHESDKFSKLVFHEYIHTALGTTHAVEEDNASIAPNFAQQTTVDYAQVCGDYCFSGPDQNVELTRLSKIVCQGSYSYPSSKSDNPNIPADYASAMNKIRNIKIKMK
jgi:hypothetical protein